MMRTAKTCIVSLSSRVYLFSDQTSIFATASRRVFVSHFSSNASESLGPAPYETQVKTAATRQHSVRSDPSHDNAAHHSFGTNRSAGSTARSCQPFMPKNRVESVTHAKQSHLCEA